MDALTLIEPKKIEITSLDSDLRPGSGEALVEVDRISLCGSDYKLFNGTYSGPSIYPLRFGHEWSGKVMEIGPNVNRVRKGDKVTGDCSIWCGTCPNCAEDRNLCQKIKKYGITQDGFSQQLKVVPEKYLYSAPSSIPYSILALTEPFAVALHAIHRLGKEPQPPSSGKTLIIGCGMIGTALYLLLKYKYNWKDLEIYDTLPERTTLLQKIMNPRRKAKQPVDHDDIPASADYSLVFEAAGEKEALEMAFDLARPRGTIISLGMFPQDQLNFGKIVMKALSVIGSIGGTGEFPEVFGFFEKNLNPLKSLVTARYPYQEAEEAFSAGQNLKKNLKVQIQFSKRKEEK